MEMYRESSHLQPAKDCISFERETMFVKVLLLVVVFIACASAFTASRFGARVGKSVRMAEEPWFPGSVTSNTVSIGTLE